MPQKTVWRRSNTRAQQRRMNLGKLSSDNTVASIHPKKTRLTIWISAAPTADGRSYRLDSFIPTAILPHPCNRKANDAFWASRRIGWACLPNPLGGRSMPKDIRRPGMRFRVIRRSPYPACPIRNFDATQALATPGVESVLDIGTSVMAIANTTLASIQALGAINYNWTPPTFPPYTHGHFDAIARSLTPDQHESR